MAIAAAITDPCPPGAAALGVAGLGSLCQVAGAAAGLVGSAASQVAGFGVDSILGALGSWVSQGAVWLLDQVGAVLTATTSVDLGASWFTQHYETMAALCGVVIVPLLTCGVIQAVYRQDLSMLLRAALLNVPLALLLTAVAVKLVQLGLAVTDDLSSAVAQGAGLDAAHFMSGVAEALTGAPGVPAFVVFLGGIAVVAGAFLVWIELLIRAAAVYVAVLFLPLALASLAWPAISHWCRRLVDTLVALVLGKFVIVSVLSLAAGALAAGTAGSGGGFTAVLGGAALLLLAALAPWALFRLLPFVEAGAVSHLEGVSQRARQAAKVPARGLAQIALRLAGEGTAGPLGLALGGAGGGALSGGTGTGGGTAGTTGPGPRRPPDPGGGPGAEAGRSRRARPAVDRTTSTVGGAATGTPAEASAESGPAFPSGAGIPLWQPDAEFSELARQLAPAAGWGTHGNADGNGIDPLG
ncbi:MAG TPA: hypothetical protein VEJ21_02395, partial [Acidimicrobiales bacterium]|nr:hypothetical protein [Acidimicrobiales bacterium]